MVASISKGAVAQYYLRRTEYYLGGNEPAGVWLSASSRLGITVGQKVEADLFEKLHAGLGPDGRRLITNDGGKERVSGFDLTLSAPKSVSIAYALADAETRAAIEQVQLDACKAVVALLNREAAFTRRGRNGVIIEKTSLIVAGFQHAEARPAAHIDGLITADMDLHSHLCIVNAGEKSLPDDNPVGEVEGSGRYGALDARSLFRTKMLSGSVYHLALSSGLQKLGFEIEITGKNGIFELVTPEGPLFDQETRRYFSARRNQLEERLAEYDVVSGEAPELAAAVTKATRLSKTSDNRDRFDIWREQARSLGVDVEHCIERARTSHFLSDHDREALIAQRLADIPATLTEHESVFERRHLMAAVASSLVGTGAEPGRVDLEVERLTSAGQIVQLATDIHGHGLYSTPEMIAIERNLLKAATSLAQRRWSAIDEKDIEAQCNRRGLSDEQRQAALTATDGRALAIVEGSAGSGKTTTLKAVVDTYRSSGRTVLGGAIAHRTAAMLRSELNIDATAIDRLLAQIKAGRHVLDRNTVLLVDECGQIGSRAMNDLVAAVAQAQAKLVLVGDREQLQPISAGPALKILATVVEPARVDKIVRQRDEWAQAAARAFAKGRADEGLRAYAEHGLLQGHGGAEATISAAVDSFIGAQRQTPDKEHLLIAQSNKTVRALNAEIRRRMRDAGRLTGPDHVIVAGDASGRGFRLRLAVGDKIRFGIRHDGIGEGVINGTVGWIEEIAELDGQDLLIRAIVNGKRCEFSTEAIKDKAGRVRLGHDLAVTAYSAQGLTAETATVVLGSEYDRHTGYVALSRARGETRIVYDKSLLSAQAKGASEPHVEQQVGDAAEIAYLATRLSRANLKTSTLALSAEAEQVRGHRNLVRDRDELSL